MIANRERKSYCYYSQFLQYLFLTMSNAKFKDYKKEISAKRQKRNTDSGTGKFGVKIKDILQHKEIIVQRLSADVTGKAQKFFRMGPQEFVKYYEDDITIEGIKNACNEHYKLANCDVLVGERGPSARHLDHLSTLNIVFVRFLERPSETLISKEDENDSSLSLPSTSNLIRQKRPIYDNLEPVSKNITPKPPPRKLSCEVPKSISLTEMLKMGKTIENTLKSVNLKLEKFDIGQRYWVTVKEGWEWKVEEKPFANGCFRNAYKVTSYYELKKEWVLKKLILDPMKERSLNKEEECRRTVQTHMLAKYFTDQLASTVDDSYGEIFLYNEIYLARLEDGEYATIEEYLPGKFTKYVNNNALLSKEPTEIEKKVESLMHFSYVQSKGKLLLTDIQGVGYSLVDPEIASFKLKDDEDKFLFAAGNLSVLAIKSFVLAHKCNRFCKMLNLSDFTQEEQNAASTLQLAL